MVCIFVFSSPYYSILITLVCVYLEHNSCFVLKMFGCVFGWTYMLEIRVMDAARVPQTWWPRLLYFLSYTFSVLAHSHRQCADLPVKFHWGSPHFFTSLLSPSSHTPLFISFFPSSSTEGSEDWFLTYLGLPLNDGQLGDEDYSLCVTKKTILGRPWPRPFLGQETGTKEERCPVNEVGGQLMLPEDVLEWWRDVNPSHSYSLLPPSLSFSLFLYLAACRAYSKHFWDPGHLPFSHLLPFFVRESLFVQTTWRLTKLGRHLHCLTELRHLLIAPKSHGKG